MGSPRRLPLMSQSAMSTAEMRADPKPRLPVLSNSEKSRVQM